LSVANGNFEVLEQAASRVGSRAFLGKLAIIRYWASTARPCVFGAGKLYWSASRTVACPSGREPTFLLAQGLALGRAVCERGL